MVRVEHTRSFCYVDDLVKGILLFFNSDISFTGPVNIGNPEEYKILDLAKLIIKMTDSNSQLKHLNLPQDDPKKRKPNIDLISSKINWFPETNLIDGLQKQLIILRVYKINDE